MPNFSSSGFANASSYSKFVKLLQDISMTSQFHRKIFAVLVWQIIWSQSCDCLFWESFSPLWIGGKFKFQVFGIFFILEIWRFEKRIAFSEKKPPFCNMRLQKRTLLINMGVIYVIHSSSYIKLMQCMKWRQAELKIQK